MLEWPMQDLFLGNCASEGLAITLWGRPRCWLITWGHIDLEIGLNDLTAVLDPVDKASLVDPLPLVADAPENPAISWAPSTGWQWMHRRQMQLSRANIKRSGLYQSPKIWQFCTASWSFGQRWPMNWLKNNPNITPHLGLSKDGGSAGTNPTPRIYLPFWDPEGWSGSFCQRSGSFKDPDPSEDPDLHKDLDPRLLILDSSKVVIYTLGMIIIW